MASDFVSIFLTVSASSGLNLNGCSVSQTVGGPCAPAEAAAAVTLLVILVVVVIMRSLWYGTIAVAAAPNKTHWYGALVGADNRLSTSKTIAFVWTVVIAFMVITIGYVSLTQTDPGAFLVGALTGVSLLYLVLLGGPYAAAVLAKLAVSTQTSNGTLQKTSGTPSALDVVVDDTGGADLYDLQYTLFNLIAVLIVLGLFVPLPGRGFPLIPDFLALLTGGAALTYTFNKTATPGNGASITSVAPQTVRVGTSVTLYGQNLAIPAQDTATVKANTVVMIGGQPATIVNVAPDQLKVTVPPFPGGPWPMAAQDIELKTNGGSVATLLGKLSIVGSAPLIQTIDPNPISGSEPTFEIRGHTFLATDPVAAPATDVPQVRISYAAGSWDCRVTNAADPQRDLKLIAAIPAGLAGAFNGAKSMKVTVSLSRIDNATAQSDLSAVP